MFTNQADSIEDFLEKVCGQAGEQNLFTILESSPESLIESISGLAFLSAVKDLALRQRVSGIGATSRVAILGPTSHDFLKNFFAALINHADVCPLDTKLSLEELANLSEHFGATHLLVTDQLFKRPHEIHLQEKSFKLTSSQKIKRFDVQKQYEEMLHASR